MKVFIDYEIEVLNKETDNETTLKIRVSREEDIFTIYLGDKEVCYGTWTTNLLTAFESICHIEKTIES